MTLYMLGANESSRNGVSTSKNIRFENIIHCHSTREVNIVILTLQVGKPDSQKQSDLPLVFQRKRSSILMGRTKFANPNFSKLTLI